MVLKHACVLITLIQQSLKLHTLTLAVLIKKHSNTVNVRMSVKLQLLET